MKDHDRQHERLAIALEVEYRTTGAFLVAYSANLSTGGMFVECNPPLAVGTELALKLNIPGVGPIELSGVVAWTRAVESEGKPPGMGIRFVEAVEARYGAIIDRMVSTFRGLRVVVQAQSNHARSALVRAVKSMLASASVLEAGDSVGAEEAFAQDADLAVIDLDDARAEGLVTLRMAKVGRRPIPVIITTREDDTRVRARELGADEVLANPPAFPDLQTAIIRALAKPSRVG